MAKRDRLARGVVITATIERAAERVGAAVAAVVSVDGMSVGDGPAAELFRRLVDALRQPMSAGLLAAGRLRQESTGRRRCQSSPHFCAVLVQDELSLPDVAPVPRTYWPP